MSFNGPVVFSSCFPVSVMEYVNIFSGINWGRVDVGEETHFTFSPMPPLLQDNLLREDRFEL